MKKILYIIIVLFVGLLASCSQSADYTILDEEKVNKMTAVSTYVAELQSSNSNHKGYRVFDISDGNKVVVISSGEPNKTLKVHKVEKSSKDTSITTVLTDSTLNQKNSYCNKSG